MPAPDALFRDWGAWGWFWALGWFGFILGLLLVPDVLAGLGSPLLLLLPPAGAALMLGSAEVAGKD